MKTISTFSHYNDNKAFCHFLKQENNNKIVYGFYIKTEFLKDQ